MNYLEESGKWLGLEKDDIIDESVVKFFSSYTARELKLAAAREYIHHAHNFTRDKNMERKLRGYIKASDKQINCLKKELLKFENGDDRYKEKVIKDFIKYENKKWDEYSIKKWYNHQIDFYTGEKKIFESSLKSYLKYKNNMNEATYMNEGLFKKSKTIDPKIEPKAAISKAIALIKKYSKKYTDIKNISDAKYDILNQQKNKETFYTDFINNKEDQIDLIVYDIEAKYEDRNQIINLIDKQLIPDVNYELNKVGYSVEITDINGSEVIIDLVKGATINESYNFKTEGISMNTINKLVSLSESYNIKNSDRLRNDIVSEYTETINSLDSIDESVIVKDIRTLPVYKINEEEDFNDFLHKNYIKESEWKSKYRNKFITVYKNIISKLKNYDKQLPNDQIINYPDKDPEDWPSKEIIKYMDNYKGGPNDRKSGICTKSLVVCEYNESKMPLFKKKTILNQLEKIIRDCIPNDLQNRNEKMYFIIRHAPGRFLLIANSIIMNESYAVDLDSLKYVVQNEQCSLEEASNLLKRINNIDEDYSLYCVLPKNINENMSIESFINLNNMLNEAGIESVCIKDYNINEFINE